MIPPDVARFIEKITGGVYRRVQNIIGRAVLSAIDDSKGLQVLQAGVLDGEDRDDMEHFQSYGFTSKPKKGAEAIIVFPGGKRDGGIVICVADRRYRLKDLGDGEVAMYGPQQGQTIIMKANGDIEVTPKSGQKTKFTGDVDVSGTLTATTDVMGGGKSLKNHVHSGSTLTTTATVGLSTPGAIAGSTAAPT